MLPVSDAAKASYMIDGSNKQFRIKIESHGADLTNSNIVQGSLNIQESILTGDSLEFVGCIASKLEVTILDDGKSYKACKIEVWVTCNNTDEIKIFTGWIDSAKKDANKRLRKIVAYDLLYKFSEIDASDWYNSIATPEHYTLITINEILDRFKGFVNSRTGIVAFNYVIPQPLVNGDVIVLGSRFRKVSNFSALDFLKHVCQFNGCFGIINRDGNFEFRYLGYTSRDSLYPSDDIFPYNDIFPNQPYQDSDPNYFQFYKKVTYEDYHVHGIETVEMRPKTNEPGVRYPNDFGPDDRPNTYRIQQNIFSFDRTNNELSTYAQRIYVKVKMINYLPFTSDNNGCPFLECGDEVIYNDMTSFSIDKNIHFIIFSRNLKGDQVFRDAYKAEGQEYQSVFISDLSPNLEELETRMDDMEDAVSDLDDRVKDLEDKGTNQIVSVDELPSEIPDGYVFLVQGEIIVI